MGNPRATFLFLLGLALPAVAADHIAPPVQPATTFAAVEVHDKEQVAIAAEPYDTKEKESIFRVDYLSHGVMPVRLIVTNRATGLSLCAMRGSCFRPRRARGCRPQILKTWNG